MAQDQESKVGPQRNLEAQKRREAYWRRIIDEQAVSGMNHSDYCRSRSIPPARYFWWRHEIGIRDAKSKPRAKNCSRATSKPASVSFIPVHLRPSAAIAEAAGTGKFEVVLAKERLIRVPANFDAASLTRLIACLEASC